MDAELNHAELNLRDVAAQDAFERYERVLSAALSSHARSGRVLDQWEVEDLATSLPEYQLFTAVQREYNAAVGAVVSGLGEPRAEGSTRDGDALPSSPLPLPRATLATPASRRASAGGQHQRLRASPHKRRRLFGRMLNAVRYPQRLLRLRRPGTALRARDKYVDGTEVGRGAHESSPRGSATVTLRNQTVAAPHRIRRSAKPLGGVVVGPA